MRRTFLLAGTATLITAGFLAAQSPDAEVQCKRCYWGETGTGQMAHLFDSPWWGGGELMDCNAFNSCHVNSQVGTCSEYHYYCTAAMREIEDRVQVAIESGNAAALTKLIRANPRVIERHGSELRFLDCQGAVAGILPITESITSQRGADV